MTRDLRRLADTRFDVVIVGAGIYGVAVAWDAAQRGLSVAIIDRGDFGGATSFNNLKTLHGGLRSLSALDLRQMRLFVRERRAMARIVPHLVRPLGFVVATSRRPDRSPLAWRALLAANDAMAHDRNEGLDDPAVHLPPGHLLSRHDTLRLNPVISPDGVTGGAVWYDYQMVSADRVTLSFLLSAVEAGASAANYVRARAFLFADGRVCGVSAEDTLSGQQFDIRGAVVVNAAGPWAASILSGVPRAAEGTPPPRLSRGMNLVTRPVVGSHACAGVSGGRFFFLVPWGRVSMFGTSHDAHRGSPDELSASSQDVHDFLRDARAAFPLAALTAEDVRLVHRGLLPMVSGDGSEVRLLKESLVVDHRRHGVPGLVSIFGVRYTTARQTAEDAVDVIFRSLGHQRPPPCRTAHTPLAGGRVANRATFLDEAARLAPAGLSPGAARRIATAYGAAHDGVLALIREDPALGQPLSPGCDVTGAELLFAVRREMAVTLADAILRRTDAGAGGHPGSATLQRAAEMMGGVQGWDAARTRDEIGAADAFYRLTGPGSPPHFP